MKAIIIARVSTEEQKEAGNSLPAQVARLEGYSNNKGFQIIKKFSFDESAYKDKRSDFDDILDFVIGQKEKIAVCFDKVDRLSRNIFDKRVALLYEKALRDEIEIHFVSDGQIITSHLSAVEKFNFSISLGLAKYYSDAISDSVKRAQEQMIRKGVWPSKAPIGYKNVRSNEKQTEIQIDPDNADLIRKAFEWYATGNYSLSTLRKRLKESGLAINTTLSQGVMDWILKNPFYYGEMVWNGKKHPHKYAPLITRDVFIQVQKVKEGWHKKPFKWASKPFVFRGLVKCSLCGCMITGEVAKKKYRYYHCTNYFKKHAKSEVEWIKEEDFIEQVAILLKKLQMPDYVLKKLTDVLKKSHEDESDYFKRNITVLEQELGRIKSKLEIMYDDKLEGRITSDMYDRKALEYIKKRDDIVMQIENHTKADSNYYIEAKKVLDVAQRSYEIFKSSEDEEKRQFLQFMLQNSVLDGRKVEFTLQKPFDDLLKYAELKAWLALMDSETTTAVILATSLLVLAAIGVLYIVAHDPTSSSRRLRLLRLNTMRRVLHGIGMSAFIGRSVITFSRPVLAIVAFISVIAISVLSLNTSTAFAGDAGLADAGNSSVLFGIAGAIAFAFALALAGVATLKFARR
ncbi:MAG: hypothetical protein A2869_01960 [Candidatus Levybacteria bacterium RIFCSPHIGHO2_01_FULL_40_58]|nr:MAG: hypothetical protein A2869_01960 [Candidatus Levybacteria bacterium RIFCSPHIGHO2_01_FULL_40_58]OGH39942.1 MAG: hypothetical protein A2894_02625 [Candidatus Levybacteria bacterium RIFCSPLOWO2_01_FULL_40_64]